MEMHHQRVDQKGVDDVRAGEDGLLAHTHGVDEGKVSRHTVSMSRVGTV